MRILCGKYEFSACSLMLVEYLYQCGKRKHKNVMLFVNIFLEIFRLCCMIVSQQHGVLSLETNCFL